MVRVIDTDRFSMFFSNVEEHEFSHKKITVYRPWQTYKPWQMVKAIPLIQSIQPDVLHYTQNLDGQGFSWQQPQFLAKPMLDMISKNSIRCLSIFYSETKILNQAKEFLDREFIADDEEAKSNGGDQQTLDTWSVEETKVSDGPTLTTNTNGML